MIYNKSISFSNKEFQYVLNKYNYNLNPGDIVAGTIFNKETEGFLVDVGVGIAGYLPKAETLLKNKNISLDLINQTREFFIIAKNQRSKQLILSIKRLDYIRAWKRIKQLEEEDIIIEVTINSINKGGILINLEGLIGFIPNSHLVQNNNNLLTKNNKIKCQLLIANEQKNQLILSNKRALLAINSDKIKLGQTYDGKIIEIKDYGLFIRIYGIHALLHISEIGDKHIDNIYDIFNVGQIIKVKIMHIDIKQGRISVSTRNII